VNCIQDGGNVAPYWVDTSNNKLILSIFVSSSARFKEQFELLLQEKPVEQPIDENCVFSDLTVNESTAWNLLLVTGYLKVISQRRTAGGPWCMLAIPNKEIKNFYRQIIELWLSNGHGIVWYNKFIDHLLTGNIELFENEMKESIEKPVSHYYDTDRDSEKFYHGLMMGFIASLYHSENYDIQSNKESGHGRYNYMIFSRDRNKPTVLLEFKKINSEKETAQLERKLVEAAQEALNQMSEKRYLAEAQKRGSTNILKIGLAFCGKRFAIQHEHIGKVLDPEKMARKTL
jgi:hypothetical protein